MDLGVPSKNILVSPSGVDMDEYSNIPDDIEIKGLEDNDFIYGYIGTLKTMGMEKAVKIGLETLKLLPPNFKFLIVGGGGDDLLYYKNIALELGVNDRAIFLGEVSHSQIYSYSKKCDVLVAPFPENEHYNYFMSPLKIFEYMASKRPIIATDLPSIREVLVNGENSILVPPSDSKALADAIISLKEDSSYAEKISNQAFSDVIKKYTWQIRVKNIITFIKSQ